MPIQTAVKHKDSNQSSLSNWLVGSVWALYDFDGVNAKPRKNTWNFYSDKRVRDPGSWDMGWSIISDERVIIKDGETKYFELVFITHDFFIAFNTSTGRTPPYFMTDIIHAGYLESGMGQLL